MKVVALFFWLSATFVQATDAGNANSEYCRVMGSIKPVDTSAPDIKFQVNLPSSWNQKALGFGDREIVVENA